MRYMIIYYTFISFLFGLVIASFFNALLYRIDNGYKYPDIFLKGSHCEKCGKLLKTYELVPILSFLIFRGKCYICGYKIPLYYPISELMLGLAFAGIYYFSFPSIFYIVILFFFSFSYFDRMTKHIPAILVDIYLFVLIVYFFINILLHKSIPENAVIVGLIFSFIAFILGKVLKKPFGMGDVLVLVGLSLILTIPMYIGYLYIFLIVSLSYSFVRILTKQATMKTLIPLLPLMYVSLTLLIIFNKYVVEIVESLYYF